MPPQKMRDRLHVLGNLTVYPQRINSEMSNHKFGKKLEILQDPDNKIPLLQINATKFLGCKKWTYKEIDDRTRDLVSDFLKAYK